MSCTRELSITINEPEAMPLNSAAYVASRDAIYACRGGYVFKCSATTGLVVSTSRFIAPEMDDTYLDYDITTDRIWAVMKRSFGSPSDASFPAKYLVSIHPDTLVATTYNFRNQVTNGDNWASSLEGPKLIKIVSGIAFTLSYTSAVEEEIRQIHRWDLTTSPPSETHSFPSVQGGAWGDLHYDGSVLWYCSNDGFNSIDARTIATLAAHTDSVLLDGSADRPYGITRNPAGAIYAVQATQFVLKGTPAGAPVLRTVIDLGRANATPVNIKYNSADSRIYIPCWKDDTVVVLNPADDSFVVKSGFDSPFDMVFTPTKSFAVQHGARGLKEVV